MEDYKKLYYDLLQTEKSALRERIAMSVLASASVPVFDQEKVADRIYSWITNNTEAKVKKAKKKVAKKKVVEKAAKKLSKAPPWEELTGLTLGSIPVKASKKKVVKPKRKYVKKDAYWKDPTKAKAKKAKKAKRVISKTGLNKYT